MALHPQSRAWLAALVVALAAIASCTTTRTMLAPKLPVSFTRLGSAHGEACSSVVPWAGALQSIPVSTGSRFDRAYQAALASVPGATMLADVTFQERYYWAVFGTVYCTTVSGEAGR